VSISGHIHKTIATLRPCKSTLRLLIVHRLPDKWLAWLQSCEGFVNMAPERHYIHTDVDKQLFSKTKYYNVHYIMI
jgi:hypothetical protein